MSRFLTAIVACGLLTSGASNKTSKAAPQHWKLSWSDEFSGPDGAPPDPAKWEIATGGNGFGNNELERRYKNPMALEASRNSLNLNQPNGARPFFIWRMGGLQVSPSD